MYQNYGDVNFFEYGVLIDDTHTDSEFDMLRCMPYSDEEDLFMFAPLHVDLNDGWMEIEEVMDYAGIEEFDPVEYAIACTDYYSWDNFISMGYYLPYDWQRMTRKEIIEELKSYDISFDNLKPFEEE